MKVVFSASYKVQLAFRAEDPIIITQSKFLVSGTAMDLRFLAKLSVAGTLLVGGSAFAQSLELKENGIACETFSGASDFWQIVDKRPSNISIKDWYASIGCYAVPGRYPVAFLDKFDGVVRGLISINGKAYEVYFPADQLKDLETGTTFDNW